MAHASIIGGLGGVLSFILRRSLEESPEFERMKSLASRQPFRELLRTHIAGFINAVRWKRSSSACLARRVSAIR